MQFPATGAAPTQETPIFANARIGLFRPTTPTMSAARGNEKSSGENPVIPAGDCRDDGLMEWNERKDLFLPKVKHRRNDQLRKYQTPEVKPKQHRLDLRRMLLGVPTDQQPAAEAGKDGDQDADKRDRHVQSLTGDGASTTREPFDSAGLTTPAASIVSIIVAARL